VTRQAPGDREPMMRQRLTAAAITSLARWTPYLESELCGLHTLVQPGSVCIDVGSAAGIYTAVLERLVGPAGQVHSIEPLPFAHLLWTRTLAARRQPNVRHHTLALGTETGTETMSVPVGRYGLVTGRSFLARRAGGPDPNTEFDYQIPVTVTVDTLDNLCARENITRLDFIKIDVEGAELQILHGGQHTITTSQPVILAEIEARHTARYHSSPDTITTWLTSRGYTMHTWHHGWHPARHIDPATRNYLFCPPALDPAHPPQTKNQRKLLDA
jgi:FkbM family methyltransferase